MSSLLRVRVSSFLAGIAVAGSAALYWLRDDVRHSFETLHTHVSAIDPLHDTPPISAPDIEAAACTLADGRLQHEARPPRASIGGARCHFRGQQGNALMLCACDQSLGSMAAHHDTNRRISHSLQGQRLPMARIL